MRHARPKNLLRGSLFLGDSLGKEAPIPGTIARPLSITQNAEEPENVTLMEKER
jgi:hypothetical protein